MWTVVVFSTAKFLANIHQEIGYSTCIGQVLETITQWRDGLTHSWWTDTTSFNLQQATLRSQKTPIGNLTTTKLVIATSTQARRHHATVDPVLLHDWRPHRRSKYWGGKFLFPHQHFYRDHISIEEKELLKEHAAGPDEMFWGAEPVCARDPLLSQELHRHLAGGDHYCSPHATLWSWICHPTSACTRMSNVQHVIQNPHHHSLDHLIRSRWFQSRTRQTWLSSSSATTETSRPSRWPVTFCNMNNFDQEK